ncbi:restriction endonuclease subunit S [Staphylococcus hominis]|uniref:restriction endonuclease subunit S n=1 Tax=Staphylococcus hominis TaxID=1290 RepID=UPI001F567303|nr:restriction endonuclease subunit S [Staphylococcus hominis]MCI2870622.1 restriction endonuclease subunit S [Staphylococcus hominis]MCI2874890.1 restriction endonuclease subunit S [Staphylococcus hominis]
MTEIANTPELRFPNYENSWFSYKLNDISERVTRKNKNLESQRSLTISGQLGLIDQIEYFNKSVSSKNLTGYTLIKKGEFAYNKSYSNGYPLGAIKKLERYDLGILSSLYICFSFNENIDKNFMKNYFESTKWYREVANIAVEGARNHGLLNIPVNDFFNININLPIQYEQEKIGKFFSKLDRQIELEEEKLELLEQQKKSYMQKIFSQELRFKDENGNEYPEWKIKRIDDVYTVTRGYVLSKKEIKENIDSEYNYPVYSSQTSNNGLMGYYNKFLYENAITWTTDGANAGRVNFRSEKFYCTNVCGVLLSDEGYSNKCMAEKLNSIAYKYVSKVGNPKLMNNVMSNIKLAFPCLEEQAKISKLLMLLDKLIDKQRIKVSQLKNRKQGLLQKMFV